MTRSGRIHRAPLALAGLFTLVVGAGGASGVYFAEQRLESSVERIGGLEEVLVTNDGPAENFLIVGSDSRANADPDAENASVIGDESDAPGNRSDTIIILRRDPEGGASLLSIPRDLWVPIAGRGESGKINGAFTAGPQRLAETITQALGIPINHYIEVDFNGFTNLVDEIGGVEICVEFAVRDTKSGLALQPGCQTLDGTMALAYTRSRNYEEFADGDWRLADTDGPDLGRIQRQQHFISTAGTAVLERLQSDPLQLGNLLDAATELISFDASLDLADAAQTMRAAAQEGLHTFTVPVVGAFHGDQSALDLVEGAETEAILDYFRGVGPLPPDSTSPAPATTGGGGD